jgi:microcompartment protein CcmL/EutN
VKQNAIGVLEISYFSNTVVVVDQALKAAEVELASCHKRLGGRMCHTVLAGQTSAVEAAMEAARQAGSIVGEKNIKVAITISNPHPQVIKLLNMIDEHEAKKQAEEEQKTAAADETVSDENKKEEKGE